MHVEHFEKGVRYTDEELLILAKKIGKMATYCRRVKDEASVIRVETVKDDAEKKNDKIRVTVTVFLPGKKLQGESRKATAIEAIDRAVEKVEPQLLKYKELHTRKGRVRKARRHDRSRDLVA